MQPGITRLQKRACKRKKQKADFSLQQPLCLGSLTNAPSASGVLDVPVRQAGKGKSYSVKRSKGRASGLFFSGGKRLAGRRLTC